MMRLGLVLVLMLGTLTLFAQAEEWLWATQAGGTGGDYGQSISTDASGNSYVTGYFQGTASFGGTSLNSIGDRDIVVAKAGTPVYQVIAPNGGEHWQAGSAQAVYWHAEGGYHVNIQFSADNGENWIMLNASPVDVTLGMYAFTVPLVDSDQCLMRVQDAVYSYIFDVSDAPFAIIAPLKPPTGLQTVITGYDMHLSWDAVTETIFDTPITPDCYVVLYNETPYEDDQYYYYQCYTPDLTAIHGGVALFRSQMFYRVVAVKFYRDADSGILASLPATERKITWGEVKGLLEKQKQ